MKEFLSSHQIAFEERNISEEPAYVAELKARGFASIPVLVRGDEAVEGFDRAFLEQLFGLSR